MKLAEMLSELGGSTELPHLILNQKATPKAQLSKQINE
jgi:hypothetical protein